MISVVYRKGSVMRKSRNGYYRNRHSCFLLQYHLVLVTKYRHPVLKEEIESFLKEYTKQYFEERDLPVLKMEVMPDHCHILFEAPPQLEPAGFVNAFKSASSRQIRKRFEKELKPYYWKPYLWSLSYFIGSVSERTTRMVMSYIEHQKD